MASKSVRGTGRPAEPVVETAEPAPQTVQPEPVVEANDPASVLRRADFIEAEWYASTYFADPASETDVYAHYVTQGESAGNRPNRLFLPDWYRRTYGDSHAIGPCAAAHFVTEGVRLGLRPNPLFDPTYYIETNADVAASGMNPVVHFLRSGAEENRAPAKGIYPAWMRIRLIAENGMPANPLADYLDLVHSLEEAEKAVAVRAGEDVR